MIGRETYELTRLYWLGYSGGVDTFWYFVVSLKAVPLFRWCNLFPHFFDIKSKLSVITMKKSLLLVVERERRSMLFPFCRNSRVAALVPGILFLSEFRFLCTYVYTFNSFIYFPSFFFLFLCYSHAFFSYLLTFDLRYFSSPSVYSGWMDGYLWKERRRVYRLSQMTLIPVDTNVEFEFDVSTRQDILCSSIVQGMLR